MSAHGRPFPGAVRLKTRADFDYVFADAARVGGRYFTILVRPSTSIQPRVGLIVAKKVDKRAVERNRVKRLIRESFRAAIGELPALDCAVLAKPEARAVSNAQLRAELDRQWRKVAAGAYQQGRKRPPRGDRRNRRGPAQADRSDTTTAPNRHGSDES